MITVTAVLCGAMLVAAGLLCALRVLRPSSLADRLVALDLLLLIIVFGVAVLTFTTESKHYLDVLVVVSLLGFVGTVTVARFIERRGS